VFGMPPVRQGLRGRSAFRPEHHSPASQCNARSLHYRRLRAPRGEPL